MTEREKMKQYQRGYRAGVSKGKGAEKEAREYNGSTVTERVFMAVLDRLMQDKSWSLGSTPVRKQEDYITLARSFTREIISRGI